MTPIPPADDEFSPSYWRERARHAENIAAEAGPINKHILEGVAWSYHEMADLMELHSHRKLQGPGAPPRNPDDNSRSKLPTSKLGKPAAMSL
jgi:hypothetical protein